MKKQCLILCLLSSALFVAAQTSTHKNNISAGAGIQWYKGDLGNSFFDFEEEWYGVARLAYNRYLNRSLDAQATASMGDIGRCFDGVLDPEHRVLILRSRFTSFGLNLKYKFANGRLLKTNARFAPFVYGGIALNHHKDLWTNDPRVNEGFYSALNGGLGTAIRLTKRIELVYNLNLGYLTTDALDFISKGFNDMYLQNTFTLGYHF